MIQIDEQSYIVGVWFSSCPETQNNWLACVIRDPENPKCFKGWSRFRYVKDDKIFDGEDEKSWTTLTAEDKTENEFIMMLDMVQVGIEEGYPDKDRVIVQGDIHKMMKLTKDKAWMHMKVEKAH